MRLETRKLLQISVTAIGLMLGPGCSTEDKDARSESRLVHGENQENLGTIIDEDDGNQQDDGQQDDSPELLTLEGSPPSVRNYDEMYRTMSALTGVPTDDDVVRTYYRNSVQNALPTSGDYGTFLGSQQLAVTKLATEFCDRAYQSTSEENRLRLFGEYGLYSQPVLVFSEQGKLDIVRNLLMNLWGMDPVKMSEDDEFINGLTAMMDDLSAIMLENNPNITDAQLVRGGVVGVCTSVLASAQVTMY